jgi:hypothetical protein
MGQLVSMDLGALESEKLPTRLHPSGIILLWKYPAPAQSRLRAVRFTPDEWMDALSLSLYDDEKRGKTEAPPWKLGQELQARGLIVIIEWGTSSERDVLRQGARALGAAVELHYLHAPVDVPFDRLQRRGLEKPPIEPDALSRWFEIPQAPSPEEFALFDEPLVQGLASRSN